MNKKWMSVLWGCLLVISAGAQTTGYSHYTKIDTVHTTGFYNIALSPEITAHLKTDYGDVRIVHNKQFVPHILNGESDVMRESYLRNLKYTVGENTREHTVVTAIADAFNNVTYNLVLSLLHTAPERTCSVSGSNDNQNWTELSDNILLSPFPGVKQSSSEVRIPLPSSSYRFFKVDIHNNGQEPFNITKVSTAIPDGGQGSDNFFTTRLVQNPAVRMIQKDSNHITYIKVRQQANYHFDRISYELVDYELSGIKYFNRKAEIYLPSAAGQSIAFPGKLYASFRIADNESYNAEIPVTNAQEFMLLIYNENDPPLEFAKIATSLNQRFITARLDSSKDYDLVFGNADADFPIYDLKIPDSSTTAQLPFLKTGEIIALRQKAPKSAAVADYKWVTWSICGILLIVLGFIGFKISRERNKKR